MRHIWGERSKMRKSTKHLARWAKGNLPWWIADVVITHPSRTQSSLPALESPSIWRSHSCASNSAYHDRNAARSSGVSCRTASSICSTVLIEDRLLSDQGAGKD